MTLTEELKADVQALDTDHLADWIGAYGNAAMSPYVRYRLLEAARRLRELAALENPGFGGK